MGGGPFPARPGRLCIGANGGKLVCVIGQARPESVPRPRTPDWSDREGRAHALTYLVFMVHLALLGIWAQATPACPDQVLEELGAGHRNLSAEV